MEEESLAYTTRSDALAVACPQCDAPAEQKCVGPRGKRRESVHRERLHAAAASFGHAPIRTLRFDGDRLIDGDGKVIGRVLGGELDIQSEGDWGEPTEGGKGEAVDGVVLPLESSSLSEGGAGGLTQTELLPDPVEETWALYVQLLERPKAVLLPKVRKWISDAHKAVGVEETQRAIRGLASSDHHRQNGYVGIEYAIRPKQGETIEGRIAMMAAKAGSANKAATTVEPLLAKFSAEARALIRTEMSRVQEMLRYPSNPATVATGEAAQRQLARMGLEAIIEDGRLAGWREA